MATILVVDDNAVDRERVRRLLGREHEIVEAATLHAAMDAVEERHVDCVILDQRLPDGEGIDTLSALVGRKLPVLMLTAQGSEQLAVQAMKRGARDYLPKHELSRDVLTRSVTHAIERGRLELELLANQEQLAASSRALEEREAKLRILLAQLPALIWTTTPELRYASIDGAALGPLGIAGAAWLGTEARGVVPSAEADADARQAHHRALSGESARYTARWKGRVFECLIEPFRGKSGAIVGAIGLALDTTEARRMEEELRQSQKMEAVGMLAGGVAHDFNNILTAILGFAGFVKEALPPADAAAVDIDEVLRAADRGRSLVKQLLAFSRRQPIEPRVFAVNAVLDDMSAMLRRLLGENIELCLELSHDVWNVRMDLSGLEQVIANLAINARDAMSAGGRLTLATENLSAHDELVLENGRRVPRGEHVVIFVTDTGTGMSLQLLERIFEPFFTTKPVGKGTGLGLSTCHGIVVQAGGTLGVRSEVGLGTTFCIYLPRVRAAAERPSTPPALEAVRGGDETVLIVEDDEQVRAVLGRILLSYGYRTLEAASGRHALELLAHTGKGVDLVLSDVVMPGLGGFEVAQILRRQRPGTRFLFLSGYNDAAIHDHELLLAGAAFMHKPVTPDALARRVRDALDAEPSLPTEAKC
jgi:signal transduction histidine kinase